MSTKISNFGWCWTWLRYVRYCGPSSVVYFPKWKLRFPGHQILWLSDWVIDWLSESLSTRLFSTGCLSKGGRHRNEIWHKGSLVDEDDAQTSNTHKTQRKRAMPHSTMKNMTCIPVSDIRQAKLWLTAHNTLMSWRHCVTSLKLSLWTSVTTNHVTCVNSVTKSVAVSVTFNIVLLLADVAAVFTSHHEGIRYQQNDAGQCRYDYRTKPICCRHVAAR